MISACVVVKAHLQCDESACFIVISGVNYKIHIDSLVILLYTNIG